MQLRTSPGGSMLNSLRNRPLEPPSSVTVTTAESSATRAESDLLSATSASPGCCPGLTTYFLSPLRSVERPVPPPLATTRNSRPLRGGIGSNRAPRLLLREEETCPRQDRDKAAQ